jgi:phosphoribosylformylglycinamidine synthase
MCVGLLREDELMRAVAQGVGNPILAVGARTGRDGIHGASFASEDLSARARASARASRSATRSPRSSSSRRRSS